jgi:RNA polymerase sigma-70 factor (ECF subfamily)
VVSFHDLRTLLRLHYLDVLTLEKIARLFHVGRTTAHRWIADAREALLADTTRRVRELLVLSDSEVDSLLPLVASQLDVSLSRLLGENP